MAGNQVNTLPVMRHLGNLEPLVSGLNQGIEGIDSNLDFYQVRGKVHVGLSSALLSAETSAW